ncbi:Rv2578c family radical SAM protein [Brachybacterium sp. GCM10030267]|uniref:Rv2578c family radical SAM protein n=1 Tax=Brachybacterium sp. GCM10030267 TaxID=3273381 RepID=UPI0036211BA8
MRWSGQEISGETTSGQEDAPALVGLSGLVRSVRTPEFQGVTFHEVTAKSALNRVPPASSMPFEWTVNPYRGCSHACVYCFARSTHRYLDLDAGADFDQQVIVKVNVADVLRAELRKRTWNRSHVALGTNTDPYQRAEGRYGLMPGIISALADSGTPLSVLTKGTLLRRDLPLLSEAAERVPVDLSMSIAVFDDELQKAIEPGTPSAAARLATVRAAADRGFSVSVFLMPIMPWLTDSDAQLDEALARIAEAGAARVVYGALHLRPGAKEWFLEWIEREHPELATGYRRFYQHASYAPASYRKNLARRIEPLLQRHGLNSREDEDQPEQRRRAAGAAQRVTAAPSALDLAPQPALF